VSDPIVINGISASTGKYLVPPMSEAEAADHAQADAKPPPGWTALLKKLFWRLTEKVLAALPDDLHAEDPAQAGWAIVFPSPEAADDHPTRQALSPLIRHRRATLGDAAVKVLERKPGETHARWLARHGAAAGSGVNPEKVPYYVLLVGSPADVPFRFGHELGTEYAVGRLHFDTPDEYARYAESVISYESSSAAPEQGKEAVFFAPRHEFDVSTQLSADKLVAPLAGDPDSTPAVPGAAAKHGFRTRKIVNDAATRAALAGVLRSPEGKPPAFLFTASHGVGDFPIGSEAQKAKQGALLCQDWPALGAISDKHWFAAADVPKEARVHGLVAFLFACFGGGTPEHDRFLHKPGVKPPAIADKAFFAALPRRLLAFPGGGALACIAHVDRAWGYSIVPPGSAGVEQLRPFRTAIERITRGWPVGHAVEDFRHRYTTTSTLLANKLEEIGFGAKLPNAEIARSWIERNDAEGYVLLGDPAARLRVAELS
jgi:hypothetical protein